MGREGQDGEGQQQRHLPAPRDSALGRSTTPPAQHAPTPRGNEWKFKEKPNTPEGKPDAHHVAVVNRAHQHLPLRGEWHGRQGGGGWGCGT